MPPVAQDLAVPLSVHKKSACAGRTLPGHREADPIWQFQQNVPAWLDEIAATLAPAPRRGGRIAIVASHARRFLVEGAQTSHATGALPDAA
jgi:hypothetical protein